MVVIWNKNVIPNLRKCRLDQATYHDSILTNWRNNYKEKQRFFHSTIVCELIIIDQPIMVLEHFVVCNLDLQTFISDLSLYKIEYDFLTTN